MDNKKRAKIVLILWGILVGFSIIFNEAISLFGTEIYLKVKPVDPRDLLRGDYVILDYDIAHFDQHVVKMNPEVYTVVYPLPNKKVISSKHQFVRPKKSEIFLKGKVQGHTIKYGIESYFVKEGTGLEIERKLSRGGWAKVKVDRNGKALLKEVMFD